MKEAYHKIRENHGEGNYFQDVTGQIFQQTKAGSIMPRP